MIFLVIGLFIVLSFFVMSIGGFFIFFYDDISEWIDAKADYLRAQAELLRKERENDGN